MTLLAYHPEMNETKPQADGEARLGYYGTHYYVDTYLELKGRGIEFRKTLSATNTVPLARHKIGIHIYRVTERSFEKLCEQYDFSYEMLLD